MGVQGLWQLLEPAARPVTLESLQGKRLAIDSSIWLHHFQMAMRDKEGQTLANAHLLGFLWRILKLLYYGIKPVFVFDGGAPVQKRRTIANRRHQRSVAKESHARAAEKLLAAQLRQAALQQYAGGARDAPSPARTAQPCDDGRARARSPTPPRARLRGERAGAPLYAGPPSRTAGPAHRDPYQLPALPNGTLGAGARRKDLRFATESELRAMMHSLAPEDLDMRSAFFQSLPPELQYELVGDLRMQSRTTSYRRLRDMLDAAPTAMDFSRAQIAGLKTRNDLTQKVLTVTDEIGSAHIQVPVRVAGMRNREYVIVHRDGGFALGARDAGSSWDRAIVVEDHARAAHTAPPSIAAPAEDADPLELEDVPIPERLPDPLLDDLVHQEADAAKRKERAASLLAMRAECHLGRVRAEAGLDARDERLYGSMTAQDAADLFRGEDGGEAGGKGAGGEEGAAGEDRCVRGVSGRSPHATDPIARGLPTRDAAAPDPIVQEMSEEELSDAEEMGEAPTTPLVSDALGDAKTDTGTFATVVEAAERPMFAPQEMDVDAKRGAVGRDSDEEDTVALGDSSGFRVGGSNTETETLRPDAELADAPHSRQGHGLAARQKWVGADGFPLPTGVDELEDEEENQVAEFAGEQTQIASFLSTAHGRSLPELQQEVAAEVDALRAEHARRRRGEEDVTVQMAADIQALLRLFGLPYVTAPMEAEAQCAQLTARHLVDGIITDDSDVFLFGGTPVYRHMFNHRRTVECYRAGDMERELGLDRARLIQLAFLLGSDYTEGLHGVGPVLAMEILALFPADDALAAFRAWWREVQVGADRERDDGQRRVRQRVKRALQDHVHLTEDWPDPGERAAYLAPNVDESDEPFAWGHADLDGLRAFLAEYLHWPSSKTDEYILPVIEEQRKHARLARMQTTLDQAGFSLHTHGAQAAVSGHQYASARLQQVVQRFRIAQRGGEEEGAGEGEEHGSGQAPTPPRGRARKQTSDAPATKRRSTRAAHQAANRHVGRTSRLS
ncbi:DNA repair protein rad2 [Malassezia sp. CBS 17886]|nr:DNA repair protein rad2 [Malassezia sp. CBS 17886]